jgi:hypothetical protein
MNIIKWIIAIWIACIVFPFILAFLGWALWIIVFIGLVSWIKDMMDNM